MSAKAPLAGVLLLGRQASAGRLASASRGHLSLGAESQRWQPARTLATRVSRRSSRSASKILQHQSPYTSRRHASQDSGPSQQQVFQSFGTPFVAFIRTVSRIARVIVVAGGSVILVGLVMFEGTHQYVEYVAMPHSQVPASFLEHADGARAGSSDDWGWAQEMSDESWGNGKGTDSRLGWRGRHLVRAAWITANWGGGLLIGSLFTPSSHAHIFSSPGKTGQLHEDEGLETATSYLNAALIVAEQKGIRLPDMAAIRAGIASSANASNVRASDNTIDETALALEMKLASLLERQGSPQSLRGAIAGYTRIYDALASLHATNRAMKSVGRTSGQPGVRADRLVRLATRIGNVHAALGNQTQAEDWLLHAVGIAGAGASVQTGEGDASRSGIFRNEILAGSDADKGSKKGVQAMPPPESQIAKGALSDNADSSQAAKLRFADAGPADTPPSPVLTRSLVNTLLALSALNAQTKDRTRLEKALQFQASALRLIRTETGRLTLSDQVVSPPGSSTDPKAAAVPPLPAQLHALWLAQHDGLASVHVAETMYALGGSTASAKASSAMRSMLSVVGLGSSNALPATSSSAAEQTREWLAEAQARATAVTRQLGKGDTSRKASALDDKWAKAPVALAIPAQRLLRDSVRLRAATSEMQGILETSRNGKASSKKA